MSQFKDLGLSQGMLKVLQKKGFEVPTPIQQLAIPAILAGKKDMVAQAQTGTGKTAAFGLPMIETLSERSSHVQAIVLTPTRELAIQVAEEISSFKGEKKLTVIPIYGGQSMGLQLRGLKKGVDIVVGTPGRILDHLKRETLKLDQISYLVLDEADEMLNMGFLEDVTEIIESAGTGKRTLMFSATIPDEIKRIAEKYMGSYDLLKVSPGQLTVSLTEQIYFEVSKENKFEALCRIIDVEEAFYGLIFCRTKVDVDDVATHMVERGYDAEGLHGDISQNVREKILGKFKKGVVNILVATDVAARGIDVQNLTHVINYSLPQDPESYVHRIGRTGRAGKEGNAITFVTPEEYRRLQFIKRKVKTDIRKAKLPSVKAVIDTKKQRIKSKFEDMIKSQPQPEYISMARELLQENSPEDVLAAFLQYSFQGQLSEDHYAEIEETTVDDKGKTRLFVNQGKKDRLTREKLVQFITDRCRISSSKIRDIQILDKFSFISLPFHEAEVVLSFFKKSKRGSELVVQKAKKSKP